MLHAIMLELRTALQARGCPVPVEYGPERGMMALNRPRIVIERDRTASDSHTGARSQRANPKLYQVRACASRCRIFAQSTIANPGVWNHEREAEQIADHVIVCLENIVQNRNTMWRITGGKFLSAQELAAENLEAWPGVVYDLPFEVDRGVLDLTWRKPTESAGSAQEEHTMSDDELTTTTRVRTHSGNSWETVT